MALSPIVRINDIKTLLGVSGMSNDSLIELIRDGVEMQARRYVNHLILDPGTDFTEFHPKRRRVTEGASRFDVVGQTALEEVVGQFRATDNVIQLGQKFARSVTSLFLDTSANFGQGTNDFSSDTELTDGVDFTLDFSEPGLCTSGRLFLINRAVPSKPGTIKVVYKAGLTKSELNDEWKWVKYAIIEEVAQRFRLAKSGQTASATGGTAAGPISKERIEGDYSVTYDTAVLAKVSNTALSAGTRSRLAPLRMLSL